MFRIEALSFSPEEAQILDQTLLPTEKKTLHIKNHYDMADAIKRLAIRGAPAIGIAAAFGVYLGKKLHVYADETRPLFQGARLTTWELIQAGIDVTLITDNMAAHVMKTKKIDAVIVGTDRTTLNGDVANKIGTYSLAINANEHGIPFYVATPFSTIDPDLENGDDIPIEERDPLEITEFFGRRIAPQGVQVYSPAFDVTPNKYVTAIITEKGLIYPPFRDNIEKWLKD